MDKFTIEGKSIITFSSISWYDNESLDLICLTFNPKKVKLISDFFYESEEILLDFADNYKNIFSLSIEEDVIFNLSGEIYKAHYCNNTNLPIIEFAKNLLNNEEAKVPELFIKKYKENEDFSVILNTITGKYEWNEEEGTIKFITQTITKREIVIKDFIEHPYILLRLDSLDSVWVTERSIYENIINNRLFYMEISTDEVVYTKFDEFFNDLTIINISSKFYQDYKRIFGEVHGPINISKAFDLFTYKNF